ncbi:hypothetical protein K1T71_007478, partial [Dendrolimus kikuchii]
DHYSRCSHSHRWAKYWEGNQHVSVPNLSFKPFRTFCSRFGPLEVSGPPYSRDVLA